MKSKTFHDVQKIGMSSKTRHDVKKYPDVKNFDMTSKSSSWRQNVWHNIKQSHGVKQNMLTF